jgi:hypothetical protein
LPKEVIKADRRSAASAVKEAYDKDPMNPDLAALLAELLSPGQSPEARKLADKRAGLKKFHPLGACVKAMVLGTKASWTARFTLLSGAVDDKTTELKAVKLMAKLHFGAEVQRGSQVYTTLPRAGTVRHILARPARASTPWTATTPSCSAF